MHKTFVAGLGRTGLLVAIAAAAQTGAWREVSTLAAQASFGPGRCGPVDSAFTRIANATGGQVFILGPNDFGAVAQTAALKHADPPLLLRAAGTATGANAFALPVDASVKRLVISSMFDNTGGTMAVTAPEGAAVASTDPTVDAQLNCGRILTIERPLTGVWRASLWPTGQFWLVVHVESDLDVSAEFIEGSGSGSTGGPMKIAGAPVAGRPATVRAQVSGPAMKSYDFVLLSEEGKRIQHVPMSRDSAGGFIGTFDLPSESFRVAVTGEDESGASYQRASRVPFHAELVEVRPDAALVSVQPGPERSLGVTIRNAGPSGRYRIVASNGNGMVSRVDPAVLEMDADTERRITVWLEVPPGLAAGTESDLIVTASGDGPRASSNIGVVRLRVGG